MLKNKCLETISLELFRLKICEKFHITLQECSMHNYIYIYIYLIQSKYISHKKKTQRSIIM